MILGVSTSEQEYLGLNKTSPTSSEDLYRYRSYGYRPASDTVTPSVTSSVTHEERMHAVHAWLVRHVSGDEFVEAGEDLEQSNMQPLLSDAWAAYNACKEAASNSTTSTWCATGTHFELCSHFSRMSSQRYRITQYCSSCVVRSTLVEIAPVAVIHCFGSSLQCCPWKLDPAKNMSCG